MFADSGKFLPKRRPMEKNEAQKIVDTHVCKGCGGNLVLMLDRLPGSYRAEYGYRCVNKCDITQVGTKKLGGLMQRYAEGNVSQRDANIIKERMEGVISMDETKIKPADGTAAQRFTAIVLREFNGLTGTDLGLNDFQKKLAQHLFVKVDIALKSFEAKRKGSSVAPYTWANVNLDKLAVDAIYRIDLGLDALIPNHIHPVPYFNERAGKYDLDLRVGYAGKDYYHRKFAVDPPVTVVYELVYSTDKFKPIKLSDGVSKYEFEITQPFDRGQVVGGFGYVIYDDLRKNQLIIVSEEDFERSRKLARSTEFWDNYPIEMRLKTLVHRVTDKIPLDPTKTNKSYAAVEKDDEIIEGTFHELPAASADELPNFDTPVPPPGTLDPTATTGVQKAGEVQSTQTQSTLENHRSSIVELAKQHLGSDAYEKIVRPYLTATFNKHGISELTLDELPTVDKWLAEQISLTRGASASGTPAPAGVDDKTVNPGGQKSKPRGRPKAESKEARPAEKLAETKKSERTEPAVSQTVPQDQVRALVKELKDKHWSNEAIKELLHTSTGKKAGWDNNDVQTIRKAVEAKEAKQAEAQLGATKTEPSTVDEVESFLNENEEKKK